MDHVLVYMTASDQGEALRIGRALVEERLAACVNVLGPIRSVFRWEGAVQEGQEVAFIAKTRSALTGALAARVKALHSYSCPCVVAVPIAAGHPAFLAWIGEATAGGG